ncbi:MULTISPECIES: inositol monophosphatase family protein [unclassified Chelatococcus]|uniref:inositol monophosphatase family protein n=1 Tax=unclassified Chelatococcus TaxID=2638111 RepID=UPI001BCAAB8B|nr:MULTISPECIES: inositol monophosphatase family protein [unclassified Chelatococcus]MBS7696604.1 inositol monophosphatase [Chelatococcus sp. YT9]MBX3555169.1 inositol monophosphatase [Chelatococcus sp.]
MIRSPLITVMSEAVIKASRSLKRDFGEVEALQVSIKGPGDFVSNADRKAETILREALEKARPGYGLVMEESGIIEGSDTSHRWHIDPLDGTTNFLHGIPHFCISVGLERDGQMVAGIIYDPIKDEMFIAEKGKGAFLNNRRVRVAARRELSASVVGCDIPHLGERTQATTLREIATMSARAAGLRSYGAAALDIAYVACGRFDAFFGRGLKSWDMAAGLAILREAGAFASDAEGGPDPVAKGHIACGNEALHRELLDVLKTARAPQPAS